MVYYKFVLSLRFFSLTTYCVISVVEIDFFLLSVY